MITSIHTLLANRFFGGCHICCSLLILRFPDVASADQQKPAGPQQDQDEDQNDDDVVMETESQEEDLQAAEVQELKPEQLDSTKASQKGNAFLFFPPIWLC